MHIFATYPLRIFPVEDLFFTLLWPTRMRSSMVESFLNYIQFEKRASPHTVLAYTQDLRQFENFLTKTFADGTSAPTADYGYVRAWIVQLAEDGIEPRSINRKIACLRTLYKFLLRQDEIKKDPMTKIRVLKTNKKLPSFVKEKDMERLLDTITFPNTFEGTRDKLMLELFYATGIRLSELIQLDETNIDLQNCTLKVLGKRNKERVIPFPINLVQLIKSYQQMRDQTVLHNLNNLFVTSKGEPCYAILIYRTVHKYLQQFTTVEKQSPHVLRHTYATHLLNKGAEINAVKDLLGHSSLAATQVYTHNSMEKLKKVFENAHPKA